MGVRVHCYLIVPEQVLSDVIGPWGRRGCNVRPREALLVRVGLTAYKWAQHHHNTNVFYSVAPLNTTSFESPRQKVAFFSPGFDIFK